MQKKRNVLPLKLRPVKAFKVEKTQKENFSGEHLKDDKQLALPPRSLADRSMVCVF